MTAQRSTLGATEITATGKEVSEGNFDLETESPQANYVEQSKGTDEKSTF